ncbi:MAG: hypothetical protein ACRDHM_07510 [Actinomycetota bacterium]
MSDRASGNGQADALPPRGVGRRRSLLILVLLLLGLPLAFVIREATDDGWREVTSVEVLEEREVIYLPQIRVFLVHADPPRALSAVSSHLGEPIAYCASSSTFEELAHGSKWSPLGYYMDGPAPRGMDRIATRARDGVVEINVSVVTDGPPRGAGSRPAVTGPFCEYERPEDASGGFLPPGPPPPPF